MQVEFASLLAVLAASAASAASRSPPASRGVPEWRRRARELGRGRGSGMEAVAFNDISDDGFDGRGADDDDTDADSQASDEQ